MDRPPVEEASARWCAGFVDGDGTITIKSRRNRGVNWETGTFSVSVYQSCDCGIPPELLRIQSFYGGSIYAVKPRDSAVTAHRKRWVLVIAKFSECLRLVLDLERYCVVKKYQARTVRIFAEGDRKNWAEALEHLKALRVASEFVSVLPSEINEAWLAGFWCAEGHVAYNGSLRASISQSGCPSVLRAIKSWLGFGWENRADYVAHADNAETLLRMIQPHVYGQKAPQIEEALRLREILRGRHGRPSKRGFAKEYEEEIRQERDEAKTKLRKLKRT